MLTLIPQLALQKSKAAVVSAGGESSVPPDAAEPTGSAPVTAESANSQTRRDASVNVLGAALGALGAVMLPVIS